MQSREYHLILPAKTGPEYLGGWAPGSVTAHWLHLKKGISGVFWVWSLTPSGIIDEDKQYFEELIDPLGKPIKVNGRQIRISRKGYFYESENHSITWEFEADYIIKDAELSSEATKRLQKAEAYIPLFRKKYLKPRPSYSWLLIRDLKQLAKPIRGKRLGSFYSFPELTEPEDSLEYRYGKRGFHLAGFVEHEGKPIPTMYHIHNGLSETNPEINPRVINANHDFPPEKVAELFSRGRVPNLRNGDFFLYSDLFDKLYSSFNQWSRLLSIEGRPFVFPDPKKFANPLDAYAEFVRFWIRLVRDVCALSNMPEIIGGEIRVLSITSDGRINVSVKP